jgi:hypothetical protein
MKFPAFGKNHAQGRPEPRSSQELHRRNSPPQQLRLAAPPDLGDGSRHAVFSAVKDPV